MGNCLVGGIGGEEEGERVKVMTSNNGIMELMTPITVESITDEFPGHGVFRSRDLFWKPIPQNEELLGGESYYLLPLPLAGDQAHHHVRSNSVPPTSSVGAPAPYRMSFDSHGVFKIKRSHTTQAHKKLQGSNSNSSSSNIKSGFWKVKLVISPQQLLEILSQESKTQELIDNVRTVAKCANGTDVVAFSSDQWTTLSSTRSRNASNNDFILDM